MQERQLYHLCAVLLWSESGGHRTQLTGHSAQGERGARAAGSLRQSAAALVPGAEYMQPVTAMHRMPFCMLLALLPCVLRNLLNNLVCLACRL